METHSQKACELFGKGYNCAQAVFAAFCDETGLGEEEALRLASSFGGGMGRLREACGAVTAMFMVAGNLYGYADPADAGKKAEHYRLIQTLAYRFKDKHGSYVCRELLGLDGPDGPEPGPGEAPGIHRALCEGFVRDAAQIMEDQIVKNGGKTE